MQQARHVVLSVLEDSNRGKVKEVLAAGGKFPDWRFRSIKVFVEVFGKLRAASIQPVDESMQFSDDAEIRRRNFDGRVIFDFAPSLPHLRPGATIHHATGRSRSTAIRVADRGNMLAVGRSKSSIIGDEGESPKR